MAERLRLDHVDGLRAVAALWVLAFHTYVFFLEGQLGPRNLLLRWCSHGFLGVPMFLVLSGFCLALPCFREGRYSVELAPFLTRRAWRILPPYYLVLLPLAALIQLPFLGTMAAQKPADLVDLLCHLLLIHNLSGEHIFRICGPFWSIALECQLYCVFPILLAGMRRPWLPTALALAAGLWMWTHAPDFSSYLAQFAYWNSLPSLLILFVLGMLAARAVARGMRLGNTGAVLGLLCYVGVLWVPTAGAEARLVGQLCIAVGTTLLLVSGHDSTVANPLRWKPLVRVGWASYTLYLTHNPLVSLAGKLASSRLTGWPLSVAAVLSMVVAMTGALVLFPIIEKPFQKLAQRRTAEAGAGAPSAGT